MGSQAEPGRSGRFPGGDHEGERTGKIPTGASLFLLPVVITHLQKIKKKTRAPFPLIPKPARRDDRALPPWKRRDMKGLSRTGDTMASITLISVLILWAATRQGRGNEITGE